MPRVLVVEDNPLSLELVVALLDQAGCQAITAETADAGLRLATSESPDLILMDMQLPGISGYEATQRLKADPATAMIPVVAITASAMRGDEDRARLVGCDAYLTKPLSARLFLDTLQRFLPGSGGTAGK